MHFGSLKVSVSLGLSSHSSGFLTSHVDSQSVAAQQSQHFNVFDVIVRILHHQTFTRKRVDLT